MASAVKAILGLSVSREYVLGLRSRRTVTRCDEKSSPRIKVEDARSQVVKFARTIGTTNLKFKVGNTNHGLVSVIRPDRFALSHLSLAMTLGRFICYFYTHVF